MTDPLNKFFSDVREEREDNKKTQEKFTLLKGRLQSLVDVVNDSLGVIRFGLSCNDCQACIYDGKEKNQIEWFKLSDSSSLTIGVPTVYEYGLGLEYENIDFEEAFEKASDNVKSKLSSGEVSKIVAYLDKQETKKQEKIDIGQP